ncbi:hypothetical protein Tco_0640184 [Tanacetum coccineum]
MLPMVKENKNKGLTWKPRVLQRKLKGDTIKKLEEFSTMATVVGEDEKGNSENQLSIYTIGIVNARLVQLFTRGYDLQRDGQD